MSHYLINGESEQPLFLLAHGAGAGMEHAFMEQIAVGLAERGIQVVRFNFPYMQKQVTEGKKRPPDRAPKLLEAFQKVIAEHGKDKPVVIGGKSMGGRMASLLAADEALACKLQIAGVACLGFPFHPPGKPEKYKGEHLQSMPLPCLILQGERDLFGKREELAQFELSTSVQVSFLPDGDHSFKPRKISGISEQSNIEAAIDILSQFIFEVYDGKKSHS